MVAFRQQLQEPQHSLASLDRLDLGLVDQKHFVDGLALRWTGVRAALILWHLLLLDRQQVLVLS